MSDKTFEERMVERDARKAAAAKAREDQKQRDMLVLDGLEQEHGDDNVMPVWTAGGLVVLSRPTAGSMKRWREAMWAEKVKPAERSAIKAKAAGDLAKTCIRFPPADEYAALVDKYPGIPDAVGAEAVKFAGIVEDEEAGK